MGVNSTVTMAKHNYKIGERIFFECYDGSINTERIIEINDKSYVEDGKEHKFKELVLSKGNGWSMSIEDYNCISPNNPKCKELAKMFKKYDKDIDDIVNNIGNYPKEVIEDIIKQLKLKFNI